METITIHFVSIFRISDGLASDDMIVIRHIVIETYPAKDDGTPKDVCIVGHAEPRSESGKPRLMNDKYMIAMSKDAINVYFSFCSICFLANNMLNVYPAD